MGDIGKIVFNPNKNDWTGLGKQIPNDVSEIKQLKTEIEQLKTEIAIINSVRDEALNEVKNWKAQADYNDDNTRLYMGRLKDLQDGIMLKLNDPKFDYSQWGSELCDLLRASRIGILQNNKSTKQAQKNEENEI